MKRNSYIFISLLLSVVLFTSCITEDEYDNSPEGNFEALWQTIDRQYCFLDYKKQEYGLDWNEIYSQYKQRISKGMNNEQLFEVLADMLNELRDGHVNLSSKLEYSQYREWFDSYPANFSDSIQRVYLGKDYAQSSGMKYQIFEDNIAYIYCGSFQSGIGEGNLDEVLNKLAICDGLIIDVRNNSGGNLTTAEKLAARFTNEKVLVGYMSHKTTLAPTPWANIKGSKPIIIAKEVIKIGRKRADAPDMAASLILMPVFLLSSANSVIKMAFFANKPINIIKAICI